MLECVECGATIDSYELGWSAFYVDDPDDGGPPELVTYCASCLHREFGGFLRWLTDARSARSA